MPYRSEKTPDQNQSASSQQIPQSPADPELNRAYSQALFHFAVLLAASFLTTFLDLPFRLISVAFALAAAAWGTVSLVQFWKKKVAHNQLAVFVLGVVASLFMAAMTGSSLARWTIDMDYQTCVAEAVTEQAKSRCFNTYEADLKELLTPSKN